MAAEKKTAEFDAYQRNGIKNLQDLFNFESAQLDKIAKKQHDIDTATSSARRELYKKEMKELLAGYKEVITDVQKEAEKAEEDRHKKRLEYYQKEYEEYKALLDKQVKAGVTSEKNKEKQLKKLRQAQTREEKSQETRDKTRGKQRAKAARDELLETSKLAMGGAGGWKNFGDQMKASLSKSLEHGLKQVGKAFNDMSNKINSTIDIFAKYQSTIDTRLQGTDKKFTSMQSSLKKAVGASPYLKTETMLTNLQTLVEAGIVTNVEQRAFLNTIKDKVAATFDAANSSLLRIIRIQQNDSTAARLGMEAYLTRMLNEWVSNTEYLSTTFDSIQSALIEASSIMSTSASTEFEYVVQKWLGVLSGQGLSENTATSLAGALGMLGSGNVSGLSSNSMNNLLVMAAANAGLDYADLLTQGLNKTNTNELLNAVVEYMDKINRSGNNVVRSQYAQTFGLNISDLMAATGAMQNSSYQDIYRDLKDYSSLFGELSTQLNQVDKRTSFAEKVNNLFDNAQFSLASNIAGNAVMSAMWKVTDMIQGVTGGINIPAISAMGSGIDLETTVENLMKLGLVGIGSIGMIGDVVTGLSQAGGGFSKVLKGLGITGATNDSIIESLANSNKYTITTRGAGLRKRSRGLTESATGAIIANSSGEDTANQTLNAAMDEQNEKLAEAQEEQDNPTADLRTYFLDVFDFKFNNLLAMVAASHGYAENNFSSGILAGLLGNSGPEPVIIKDKSMVMTTYAVGENTEPMINNISANVATITTLLSKVIDGSGTLKVDVKNSGPIAVSMEGGGSVPSLTSGFPL